jgi:radical SAM superfamily enzyme
MRFDEGYVENYTEEVFTVIERVPRVPTVHRISDENGREMDILFY